MMIQILLVVTKLQINGKSILFLFLSICFPKFKLVKFKLVKGIYPKYLIY